MLDTKYALQLSRVYGERVGISEELRGWSWSQPPVEPPVRGVYLSVSEIAGRYCPSMRDLYLRHVRGLRPAPTPRMVEGRVYHRVMQVVVEELKRIVYGRGILEGSEVFLELIEGFDKRVEDIVYASFVEEGLEVGERTLRDIVWRAKKLWRFLSLVYSSRIDEERSRFGGSSIDSIVARAVPHVAEYRVDGTKIGLSPSLSIDVFMPSYMVVDYKTGARRYFHRVCSAGYALALEAELGVEVNMGAIIYIHFGNDKLPRVSVDYHYIGDELRREFLELRDEAFEIVEHGRDPGRAPKCYQYCSFREVCMA